MDKATLKSEYNIFKQKAYIIIYGTNTRLGKLFDLVLLSLITISVIMVMLETVKGVDYHLHGLLVFMEWVITVFFSLEYILRIITNKKPYKYIFSMYGIIDLIAILPMYISFFAPGAKAISVVRALRLLRIFRILDLASFMKQGEELKMALRTSRDKILIFIYFISVICILLGSVMYVVEGHQNGFSSIPRGVYWCIVTMTTVGFGDIAPQTTLGQLIASFVMILGYGVIAVPTGIVTAEYTHMKKKHSIEGSKKQHEENEVAGKLVCKQCSFDKHLQGAKYCSQCGSELMLQKNNHDEA